MSWYFKNISALGKVLYPSLLWNLPREEKTLYLTFDDGPIPEITPWVLSLLKAFEAKATFFCIGDNIQKHPQIFRQVIAEGHSIGNHTFNHLDGWKTSTDIYLRNVALAEEAIFANQKPNIDKEDLQEKEKEESDPKLQPATKTTPPALFQNESQFSGHKKLFRPPYWRIRNSQIKELLRLNYLIVMWDIISGDFDKNLPSKKCYQIVARHAKPGSIIVFHDSLKAEKNLKEVLPKVLEDFSKKGYSFRAL